MANALRPCVHCGTPISLDARFCASCGTSQQIVCASCGHKLPSRAHFCSHCGARQAATALA